MLTALTTITLLVVLLVVLLLVWYLVRIILALRRASENLGQLAQGLEKIAVDSDPLPEKLTTINGALEKLLQGLLSVNGHLAAVARLLGR
jgi:hypothetical protein